MNLKERFLHYISFDTQSDPSSDTYPSTAKQLALLNELLEEMLELGIEDADIDANGYVTGTIPAAEGYEKSPTIGFIAHVDTSPDMSGANIKPRFIENYDGKDIVLNENLGLVMKVSDFPELGRLKGHTLITTDGTTLLGADDKAGVAEIMTAAQYLLEHPKLPHGPIRIAFTPDEEIGKGVEFFDVARFGAVAAYTMDGGFEGEIEYENFNAAAAKISIQGRNIHPGYAKNKMINALLVAIDIDNALPRRERPECTETYEGFYHLTSIEGTVEKAAMEYIIRDHSREKFEEKKNFLSDAVAAINAKYAQATVTLEMKDQYYNMKELVEPHPEIVERAIEAIKRAGVVPQVRPIRGGTDGAMLSHKGLPCPNLFAGGMNFHGKFEYCSLDSMQKAVDVIVNLTQLWAVKK